MIITIENRRTILEALKYLLESIYTDEQIRTACSNNPKVYKQMLKKKRERIQSLVRCIYIFKN
jgi:hypothetical protein